MEGKEMIPKFRAWNIESQCMLNHDFIVNTVIHNGEIVRDFSDILEHDDMFVLMQSTGLHDVNGKEIFEGDILHHPLQGMRKVYYPFLDTVASYGLENIKNGMRNTLEDAHRLYEIIGNIHEHSHLLDDGGQQQ